MQNNFYNVYKFYNVLSVKNQKIEQLTKIMNKVPSSKFDAIINVRSY